MIISHKYRFIFIKTRKVGGTSVEIALSKFLGEDDIITPIVPTDEEIRKRLGYAGPRNFRVPAGEVAKEVSALSRAGRQYGRKLLRRREWPLRFYNHIGATDVRKALGEDIWSSYFKFSIERNSYDKVCSFYFWERKNRQSASGMDFRQFVMCGKAAEASDYDLYSVSRMPAMDRIIRYENLLAGLDEVGEFLKLPEQLSDVMDGIKAKAGIRKKRSIAELYDEETRRAIEVQFAREIAYFGYRFPEQAENKHEMAT
jgi:hypothetical protein